MKFCRRPFNFIYLAENGNVRACPWATIVLGNVFHNSIEELWHNNFAKMERESIKDQTFEFCKKIECPLYVNNELENLSQEEIVSIQETKLPEYYNIAFDKTCNHKCPSCRDCMFIPSLEYKEKVKEEMNLLLPYLNKAKYVVMNGAGDVFANPELLNFLCKIKPEREDFTLAIETNGVLFNERNWKKIEHFSKFNIHVTITPNSFNRNTYKSLTGGFDNLDKLKENLSFISQLRVSNKIKKLIINSVIQVRNFHELPDFIRFCLDNYAMDTIGIKPINKWFSLSSDEFWFRDVLNPQNPLHNDYLEIMKDPIFKHEKVYLWLNKEKHLSSRHPAYAYKEMLSTASKLSKDNGYTLISKLQEKGIKSIILYGDTDLTDIVISVLNKHGFDIKYILAKFYQRTHISGIEVKCFDDQPFNDNDTILVVNYPYKENIETDFINSGFKGNLLFLNDFV